MVNETGDAMTDTTSGLALQRPPTPASALKDAADLLRQAVAAILAPVAGDDQTRPYLIFRISYGRVWFDL